MKKAILLLIIFWGGIAFLVPTKMLAAENVNLGVTVRAKTPLDTINDFIWDGKTSPPPLKTVLGASTVNSDITTFLVLLSPLSTIHYLITVY